MLAAADVLVTGSSGHLGTALMISLPQRGFTPLGLDILPSPYTGHIGSITDRSLISSILSSNPSIRHILHTATLHKPHVSSHSKEEFVDTNITGTLVLLEEAAKFGDRIESFVFISTTSTFGMALSPQKGEPAAWINEDVVPLPKNIYGITKVAAEDMCQLVHKQTGMPILILRTSRFFPEEDDDDDKRNAIADDNLKVLELAYRRVDIEDVVAACVCAMRKATVLRWGKYIISAPPPFQNDGETLRGLDANAGDVFRTISPESKDVFEKRSWSFLDRLDRVYDSSKALRELGWEPTYTFSAVLDLLAQDKDWNSSLTHAIGRRGYHKVTTGIYTAR